MSGSDAQTAQGLGTRASREFGIFVFLGSEALLFGALFVVYAFARMGNGLTFAAASHQLSLWIGTTNTFILLTSSLAAALATIWSNGNQPTKARWAMLATAALGCLFLALKAYEYADEFGRGLLPVLGQDFAYSGPDPQHARLFFETYLALTLVHALHLLSGIVVMVSLSAAWKRLRQPDAATKLAALYWHFVDIVWIFLFPALYLVR